MFCSQCGSPLGKEVRFCSNCGHQVGEELRGRPTNFASAPAASSVTDSPAYEVKNYLIESLLVMSLFCVPFGIAGGAYAVQADSHLAVRRYDEALRSSESAKNMALVGFWRGLLLPVFLLVLYLFLLPEH